MEVNPIPHVGSGRNQTRRKNIFVREPEIKFINVRTIHLDKFAKYYGVKGKNVVKMAFI